MRAGLTPEHDAVVPVATGASCRQRPARSALGGVLRLLADRSPARVRSGLTDQAERNTLLKSATDSNEFRVSGKVTGHLPSVDVDPAVVAALMAAYVTMKDEQRDAPGPYQPGADWGKLLDASWRVPWTAAQAGDVEGFGRFLGGFFRNEALTGFWGGPDMYELFRRGDGFSSLRRAALMDQQLAAWQGLVPGADVAEIEAPLIGNPWGYLVGGSLVYEPACEYHYHGRLLRDLVSDLGRAVVVEVGGGFGGLAYQFLRPGPPATYVGIDLPENAILQAYFLSVAFPEATIEVGTQANAEPLTRDHLAGIDAMLLPNYLTPAIESRAADVVINIRSLSEMPRESIEEYLDQIDRITRHYFFHENLSHARQDTLHGLPADQFPDQADLKLLLRTESRWPRYAHGTIYPCDEFLYERRQDRSP